MKKWILVFFAPVLFLVDFFLKKFVIAKNAVSFPGTNFFHAKLLPFVDFELIYIENTGMAWGMFASFQSFILLLRIALILGLCVALVKKESMQKNLTAYLLIVFGAFANVLDTFLYGFVVDMLHFTFWERSYGIFNVADAMIFTGVMMIVFRREKVHAKA